MEEETARGKVRDRSVQGRNNVFKKGTLERTLGKYRLSLLGAWGKRRGVGSLSLDKGFRLYSYMQST